MLVHGAVHKAPADGGIVDFGAPGKGAIGLGHDQRRAAHRFNAAGDNHLGLAGANGARGTAHRIQPRSAQPVDRNPRHRLAQARQQHRHARHIAIVFARLVGAADHAFIHLQPGNGRGQVADHTCQHIVGAQLCQCPAIAPNGRAQPLADIGLSHSVSSSKCCPEICRDKPRNKATLRPWAPVTTTS